jgi:endonuclease/exonuclease/phosphatase family metal-dependent hydrolase
MKIISWNLLHRSGATLEEIEHLIAREQPDLMLMQETTARIDMLPSRIGGHYARAPLPGRLHGLAAWSPSPLRQPASTLALQPGLFVRRLCQIIDLGDFSVANVHLSHGQLLNRRQLWRISEVLPKRAAIMGDCNMVGAPLLPDFQDVGPRQATHDAGSVAPLRLDRCFIRGLACHGARTLPRGASDHHPIIVRLSVPTYAGIG